MDYDVSEFSEFHITDDKTADWALRVIRDNESEMNRLVNLAKEQIKDLEEQIIDIIAKYDKKSSFLKSCLAEYIMCVPRKETKTQETYQLLSGKLIIKKHSQKLVPNDEALMKYLEKNGENFIKIKKSPDWAEFKKHLTISGDDIINGDTGEVIPTEVIAIEDVPASFDIKLNVKEEE